MANVTDNGNHTTIQESFFFLDLVKTQQKIIISAFNIPLTFTAFFGNLLIIVALQKVSSLHSPSKLLFGCLASTDLCVGLLMHPFVVINFMSPKHSNAFHLLSNVIGTVFCGVSLYTLTAISVDRLLALLLGLRYRQVVTMRRVWTLVVIFWLTSTAIGMTNLYSFRLPMGIAKVAVLLCTATSTFCYSRIYLIIRHHQARVQDHVHKERCKEAGPRVRLNIARYKKTVMSALWVQVTLLVCYLPFGIVAVLLAVTGLRTPPLNLAWAVTVTIVLLNSSLNPMLYCWKMKEVKKAVKDTIIQCCPFLN